jgi:hypothetical protein
VKKTIFCQRREIIMERKLQIKILGILGIIICVLGSLFRWINGSISASICRRHASSSQGRYVQACR